MEGAWPVRRQAPHNKLREVVEAMSTSIDKKADIVIRSFGPHRFSTCEFIEAFRELFPTAWQRALAQYRQGFRMGKLLRSKVKRGDLRMAACREDLRDGLPSPLVRCWAATATADEGRRRINPGSRALKRTNGAPGAHDADEITADLAKRLN